jgi:hypothetical protein
MGLLAASASRFHRLASLSMVLNSCTIRTDRVTGENKHLRSQKVHSS